MLTLLDICWENTRKLLEAAPSQWSLSALVQEGEVSSLSNDVYTNIALSHPQLNAASSNIQDMHMHNCSLKNL